MLSLDRLAAALCEAWEQAVPATSGHLPPSALPLFTLTKKVEERLTESSEKLEQVNEALEPEVRQAR